MMLLWIAIAIAALVLIVGYFVLQRAATGRRYTRQALEQQMEKPAYREVKAPILAADGWVSAHEREDLHVMSYDGKLLHAIYLPKKDAKGTILLFHGYKSCWQIDFGLVLPYYYDTLGYSLLLVDQRAHGSSQGKYLTFGVRERLDVLSWATYMGQKLGQNAPLILGGLSMGATTVLLASCFDFPANVRAIIADCGFTSPYEIAKSVLRRDAPKAPVSLLLPVYCRSQIRAPKSRIKEWDYYLVTDGHIGIALPIADNGYMGLDSVSFLNFDERWQITKSPMRAFPMGKTGLPETSVLGASEIAASGYALAFYHEDGARRLSFHMDRFRGKDAIEGIITLTDEPDESLVIATPFEKPGHFYYNQKINCLRASGWVELGAERFELTPDKFFAVLDWGRGVWTYHNTWYWSSASGLLDGAPFGWNLGYGFGDTSAATENALIYNGRLHKLDHVTFEIPMKDRKEDYLSPWRFTSSDGRFEMQFRPVLDRAACTDFKLLKSDQHQVFGTFTGTAVLDDGSALSVRDFFGFAEKVENKW